MNSKKLLVSLISILSMTLSVPVLAADFSGLVLSIFVINGRAYVAMGNGSYNGPVSPCSPAADNAYYMIDLNTAFGRVQYSNALAAKVTGHRAYAHGDGSCNSNPYGGPGVEVLLGIDLRAD